MGGCRCVFRDCKVATNRNPGMHFFRFPKRGSHLNDWIRFSGLENYLKLPESQQKNKVICGRHFKSSCFMNYKQERLTPTAVPTMTRLNSEWALDFEQDIEHPKLIKVEQPRAQHLIPPPEFKDPQCFIADDLKYGARVLEFYGIPSSKGISNGTQPKRLRVEITNELADTENKFSDAFLESLESEDVSCETAEVLLEAEWQFDADSDLNEQTNKCEFKTKECANCLIQQSRIKEVETILETKNRELNETKVQLENREIKFCEAQKQLKLLLERSKEMKLQLLEKSETNLRLKTEINDLTRKYNDILQRHNQLKREHETLEARLLTQETNSISKDETPESQRKIDQIQQLSKQQLFNGIKRYLSQTMIALLRMQLSSSSVERNWKPDEKRVATDLLGLGEHIYKYFTDEWLIRLPAINSVLEWRNQIGPHNDEDDL